MESRKTLINEIRELTEETGDKWSRKKMSASTVHKAYEKLTGETAKPMKGRAWHLRQISSELNTDIRKDMYHNGARLPQDALVELRNCLQQESSPVSDFLQQV